MAKLLRAMELVEDILKNNPPARDNDYILYHLFASKRGIDLKKITAQKLFIAMERGTIVPFDHMTRIRRKLQEHNEAVRGILWNRRHDHGESVKEEVVNYSIMKYREFHPQAQLEMQL